MKLYTEKEVRTILDLAKLKVNNDEKYSIDELLDLLTPIELPSDEEIDNYIEKTFYGEKKYYFKAGVEFMKEQILNQNK